MKVAPVIHALSARGDCAQTLVHTGQHYDERLSATFFDELDLPAPDHFLGVGSGTHGEQTARVILALEPILRADPPDAVVVPGDVNSTMAAALTAVKVGIPVAHLESGLRSGDRQMPEEHNRIVTDHLADLLLTTSRDADDNLRGEGIPNQRIRFVGNTMIDSLRRYEQRARDLDLARSELGVEGHVLVTLHRPALVDDSAALRAVMEVLEEVATDRPVLFPLHPRTALMLESAGWHPRRVQILEPQSYLRFLSLQATAAAVLTDSGGVQEETTVLGVPCFTLRANTERPVTITEGTNRLLGLGPAALVTFRAALGELGPRPAAQTPEGWDGRAGERAAAALVGLASEGASAGVTAPSQVGAR